MVGGWVGLDMGATHIRLCIIFEDSRPLYTIKEKTAVIINQLKEVDPIQDLLTFCNQHIQLNNVNPLAITMGLPASLSKDRKSLLSIPNLPINLQTFDHLIDRFESQFHCSIYLERDVNVQLIFDAYHFNMDDDKQILGCYLGTGFGFAIKNGRLFTGAHGVAGELGHIPLGNTGKRCGCGNLDCLETICSGKVLTEWFNSEFRCCVIDDVFIHYCHDPFIKQFISTISKAVAITINLFDPDYVILGGGVMDMVNFPIDVIKTQTLTYIRKPLPHDLVTFFVASSSDFNGATGAALYGMTK